MDELHICGRLVTIHNRHKEGVRPRFTVEGIMHPAGKLPIRFKSLDRAERHIINTKQGLAT